MKPNKVYKNNKYIGQSYIKLNQKYDLVLATHSTPSELYNVKLPCYLVFKKGNLVFSLTAEVSLELIDKPKILHRIQTMVTFG
jgi:hypothetical protein